jgi:hypothetical protein
VFFTRAEPVDLRAARTRSARFAVRFVLATTQHRAKTVNVSTAETAARAGPLTPAAAVATLPIAAQNVVLMIEPVRAPVS